MTRKKFIKSMMGAGMSRNLANGCARVVQEAGRDYYRTEGDLLTFHRRDFGNVLAYPDIINTCRCGHNHYIACRRPMVITKIKPITVSLVADSFYPLGGGGND